jgi:3-oxoacyl-[acyl-carrier protein] reductase
MAHSVAGRVAAVTGGSKGIGKGIARVLAQAGTKVAILARNGQDAQAAAQELGHGAIAIQADVTNESSMIAAFNAVERAFGGLDILCANAGIFPPAKLEEMRESDWDFVLDTNLKGTFLTVKNAIPLLKKSDQGRVVLTSSITGPITGYPGWTHYGASKAGQLGFMRTACIELAKYGITVNAVMPGNIMTEGMAGMGPDYIATMAASIPMKKLGTVDDIGHAALYFASKEAGYVTGQTIIVDGGQIVPESLEALNAA